MSSSSIVQDIDFLKSKYYEQFGEQTNNICQLFEFYRNFFSSQQPSLDEPSKSTTINLNHRIETLPLKILDGVNALQYNLNLDSKDHFEIKSGDKISQNQQMPIDISTSSLSNQQSCFSGSQSVTNIFRPQIEQDIPQDSNILANISHNHTKQIIMNPINEDSKLNNISQIIAKFPNQNQFPSSQYTMNDQTLGDQLGEFSFETQQFPNLIGEKSGPINNVNHHTHGKPMNHNLQSPSKNLFSGNQENSKIGINSGSFISPLQNKSQQNMINYSGFNSNLNNQQNSQEFIAIPGNLSPIGQQSNIINIKSPSNNINLQNKKGQNDGIGNNNGGSKNGWYKIQTNQLAQKNKTLISNFTIVSSSNGNSQLMQTTNQNINMSKNKGYSQNENGNNNHNFQFQSSIIDVLSDLTQTAHIQNKSINPSNDTIQLSKKQIRRRDKPENNSASQHHRDHANDKHSQKRKHSSKRRDTVQDPQLILNTTQDIERLELEMLNEISERNDQLQQMEESFEQEKIKQLTQAERMLQESRREASSRERFFTQRDANSDNKFQTMYMGCGSTQIMSEYKFNNALEFKCNLGREQSIVEEQKIHSERAILQFHDFGIKKQTETRQSETVETQSNGTSEGNLNFKSNGILKQSSLSKISMTNQLQTSKISTQKIKLSRIKGKKLSFNSVSNNNNLPSGQNINGSNILPSSIINTGIRQSHQSAAAPASGQDSENYNTVVGLSQTNACQHEPIKNSLLQLLINEYQKKKNARITSIPTKDEKLQILIKFWEDGLSTDKILRKLEIKEKQSAAKLSDKEIKLKLFLKKQSNELLELAEDSTTRKYGELAVVNKDHLIWSLEQYLQNFNK
ncbi:UNKNOWN [Stylonychia lemnae]|uniref:Uncharacterized protein n=1 Tax=Stylonychia lemnae TaxID=5949 RepID=A0A078AI81_STYLE|nr:UNKNOWN [Stylonychia lemnae]|eukprot:CDW80513.1 UNKNOWN [Stylonychia lemnae]